MHCLKLMLQKIWMTHFCMLGTSPVSWAHLPTCRCLALLITATPHEGSPATSLSPLKPPRCALSTIQSVNWTLHALALVPLSAPCPMLGHPSSSPYAQGSDGSVTVDSTQETLPRPVVCGDCGECAHQAPAVWRC